MIPDRQHRIPDDIVRLSYTNPILNKVIGLYYRGEVGYLEMLELAVKHLSESYAEMIDGFLELKMRQYSREFRLITKPEDCEN